MERLTPAINKSSAQSRDLLRSAGCAALKGGSIIRSLYNKPHKIKKKGEIDLVTEADLASEAAIIASLEESFPGVPFLAEESAGTQLKKPDSPTWIIDPLDGTTNFAHNIPMFCVSIALWEQNAPRIGVIYCPMQDELFCASNEVGSWLNGKEIRVTKTDFLIEALLATGFPYDIHTHIDDIADQLKTILPKVRDIRRLGAAALDLAYLACGRLDGFWEMDLKPWDTAAGMLLVEKAGGRLSDFLGKPYSPFSKEILASNSVLHDKLLSLFE